MAAIIRLEKNINVNNAEDIYNKVVENNPDTEKNIYLDLLDTEYISSAGLRTLLKLCKKYKGVRLRNVSNDVYEIFDLTGITEIADVEKVKRELSTDDMQEIGRGRFGIVYRLDEENIVKVYHENTNIRVVEKELSNAKKALKAGVPTAISYDIVKVGDLYGAVYELINAKTLSEVIKTSDDYKPYIKEYAKLARDIHSISALKEDFQDATEIFRSTAANMKDHLSQEELMHFNFMLDAIPKRNKIIHGDLHLKNVMVQNGEYILIDIGDISVGHPFIELGCLYLSFIEQPQIAMDIEKEFAKELWDQFIDDYFGGISDEDRIKFDTIMNIIATFRRLPIACFLASHGTEGAKKVIPSYVKYLSQFNATDFKNDIEKLSEKYNV